MSHPIIHIGRYHGGSDDWRTPYHLFRNIHREFSFSIDGAATKHDTLLPRFTDDIHNQSWVGERVFCNPPYSDIPSFLLKSSEADLAVFLIPYRPQTYTGLSTSSQTRFAMKSVFFIVQLNTFHQQAITGLLFVHRFQVQSLFLKKNHVSMKLRRWFAVLTRYYR